MMLTWLHSAVAGYVAHSYASMIEQPAAIHSQTGNASAHRVVQIN